MDEVRKDQNIYLGLMSQSGALNLFFNHIDGFFLLQIIDANYIEVIHKKTKFNLTNYI